jgi:succinoglycan biosynthesis protein ExoA
MSTKRTTTAERPGGPAAVAPTVSILMPVFNEEHSVAEAIASVLRQTVKDIEILVIDGRSVDATTQVVRRLAEQHPEVRLLDNPRRIIPSALNVGLQHARGEFVARVDAHLTLNDVYVETGLRVLKEHPDVAGVGGCRVGVAGSPTGKAVAAALSSRFGVGDSINHYATEPQETDHASMGVYRTEVLRSIGGWDEQLRVNEDVDLDHRILAAGHRIRYDPEMVMLWSVQETLRDFGRQYRRYGRGKAGMVRKNGPGAVKLRHLAPPALAGALTAGSLAALAGHRLVAATLLAPYPVALAGAVTATAGKDTSPADWLRLGGAFATMHLCWGVGFVEGLLGAEPVSSSGRSWTRGGAAHHSSR